MVDKTEKPKRFVDGNHCVAMMDVIGFKAVLDDANNWKTRVQSLVDIVERRRHDDKHLHPALNYMFVSDTIIIVAAAEDVRKVIWKVCQLQNAFLDTGYGLRGAITFGDVLMSFPTNSRQPISDPPTYAGINLFGPAYMRAYKIHEAESKTPRVIIDDNVPLDLDIDTKAVVDVLTGIDQDKWRFVKQFRRITEHHRFVKPRKPMEWKQGRLKGFRTSIENGLAASTEDRHKEKWLWLRHDLDEADRELSKQ
jgi:hypothetical protein